MKKVILIVLRVYYVVDSLVVFYASFVASDNYEVFDGAGNDSTYSFVVFFLPDFRSNGNLFAQTSRFYGELFFVFYTTYETC